MALPEVSVKVTIVLLKEHWTWQMPRVMFFLTFFFCVFFTTSTLRYFICLMDFLPAMARALPFLVLALVWVRCPRTGRPFLCLMPL